MARIRNKATVATINASPTEPTKLIDIESHPMQSIYVVIEIEGKRYTVNGNSMILAIENSLNVETDI